MRREIVAAIAVCLGVFILYAPARDFEFTYYDDPQYVTANPHVTSGLSLENARWAFTTGHAANWHPVTWLSHQLDASLFGTNPREHHLMNVALHALNAALLLLILSRLTGQFWPAVIAAGLWTVHPLRVESVAWVAERKDLLCALFSLLTIAAHAYYVRLTSVRRYALVAAMLALALMSKPMAVTLPFVLLLLDYWPLGRLRYDGKKSLWRLVLEKVPLLLIVTAACVVTIHVQSAGGAVADQTELPLAARLANAVVAYPRYLLHTLWPAGLVIFYPHPGHWPVLHILMAAALLVLITVAVMRARASRPYLPVGWFWFLGMLVPAIGIIQVGDQSIADRYSYLPSIGLFIAMAWFIADKVANRRPLQRLAVAGGIAAILVLCIVTRQLLGVWSGGSIALFERAIALTDDNWVAHWQLSAELADKGERAAAETHLLAALEINPDHPKILFNWANLLARTQRRDKAIGVYEKVITLRPAFAEAWNNLGAQYAAQERWQEAARSFERAVELQPANRVFRDHWEKARARAADAM